MPPEKSSELFGFQVITSLAVAPDEFVMLSAVDAVRWTPDGGVERMSEYQRERIVEAVVWQPPMLSA